MANVYRWSDHDYRFGPFIYASDGKHHRPLSLMLDSGGGNDGLPICTLRIRGFGHTFIIKLPQIIKPQRTWVDLSAAEWAMAHPLTGRSEERRVG